MWRKLLGILTLFSFLPYFSICQNKLRENGWYHILSGQTDSISREPIVTTKDFIALKLDTDYFGKYVISGQISNYKRKKWAEETGKATGRQIAFIFNASFVQLLVQIQICSHKAISIQSLFTEHRIDIGIIHPLAII